MFAGVISLAMIVTISPAIAATYVYVGNADSNDIYVLQLDTQNGNLALIEKVSIPGSNKPGGSMPLAVSPDRRFLFAALRGEPLVAATFAIEPGSGTLNHIANGPLADNMAYIATDRSGRFLFSASYSGNKIAVNAIGATGVVQAAHQIVSTEPNAHCILPDPSNQFVLSTSLGGDIVYQWRFDAATGMLSPNSPASVPVKEGAGARHLAFHPKGKFAYLINELDATIYAFAYDGATGRLSQLQIVSAMPLGFDGKPWAADIHLTPDGRYLYGTERTSSTIVGFKVNQATGMLTRIGSVPTEKQPRGFNIDPSGQYLLAVGQLSNSLTSYSIDSPTGKLTNLKSYPMGKNPNWVEIINLP